MNPRKWISTLVAFGLTTAPAFSQTAPKNQAPAKKAVPAAAKTTAAKPAGPRNVSIAFTQHKLANGLRVILSEDHSAPTVSISVNYDVGSRDERKGRTGFAHLFEHMMFQGSENVGKGEHFILVYNNGGGMNGTTNNDRTVYFETVPNNQMDLVLYLEADRMKSLAVTQENLDNQRKAVQEERRQGIDNQPYGKTFEEVDGTAYDNFAYKHSVIGSMDDLSAATAQDVQQFFTTYYAPNNCVVALVGDFKSEAALAKIKQYFGGIPSQPAPPRVDMKEPAQASERRKTIEDTFARAARLDIVFKITPAGQPDWYALDVAGDVMARGQSSRLYQKLVREKQVALAVFGGPDNRRGPGLFRVIAILTPTADPVAVEKLIYDEMDRFKSEPVSADELDKIRMQNRRSQITQLQGTLGRAIGLSEFGVAYNDPGMLNTQINKFLAVKAEDVQRVAKTYWTENNRTVITTLPKAKSGN